MTIREPSEWIKFAKWVERIDSFDPADPEERRASIEKVMALDEEDLLHLAAHPELYTPCRVRLGNARRALNGAYTGKSEIVQLLLACTIAQVPMVLLGPPGTAKSAVVRTFCEALGLRATHEKIRTFERQLRQALADIKGSMAYDSAIDRGRAALRLGERPLFEYLVTRYTTPEEILGPANIDAMLNLSLYYRESEGMLPNAEIAFLDEIFKANSAILNALLSIINERIYYNAGRAFDVDLLTIIGASNEAPDTEELAALYDRFPIRAVSDPVPDDQADELLENAEKLARKKGVAADSGGQDRRAPGEGRWPDAPRPAQPQPPATVREACVNDFRLLSRLSHVLYGDCGRLFAKQEALASNGFNFAAEFKQLFVTLRDEFGISDRTPVRLAQVAKAMAMLDDDPALGPKYLAVFRYCAPTADSARLLTQVVEETVSALAAGGRNDGGPA